MLILHPGHGLYILGKATVNDANNTNNSAINFIRKLETRKYLSE